MSAKAESRRTPRQRLVRGLTYSAVGPVDVTRGVLGLAAQSAQWTAAEVRRRSREGRLARQVAGAQEAVAGLPQTELHLSESQRRNKRPWVIAGAAAVVLAAGAVTFSIVRRTMRPDLDEEQSPRPPSVDVQPLL